MELYELTIKEIHQGYKAGKFSCEELVTALLTRTKKLNGKFNIYLTMNEGALEEARKVDKRIKEKGIDLPLLGIPIAVKDNFLTKGMVTTASAKVLGGYRPHYESTVTKKLLEAGAILMGKTNMDAWAHGSSTETSDFGPTLNPWDEGRLPGGSSGGSAAAIAAQLVPVAIGSETAGSIRQPAAWCGVVGVKPTYGRVSRYGVVAMASSTDSPGVMGRNIGDCALALSVIAGKDEYDGTSSDKMVEDYILARKDLKGLKVGLISEYLMEDMSEEVKGLIKQAAKKMEELGAEVSEVSLLDPKYAISVYTVVQRSEVSSNLARYDGIRYGQGREVFGAEAKRRIMLGTYTLSAGYIDEYYKKAQKVRTVIVKEFAEAFKKFDLLIGPVSPGPALKVGASKDQPLFGEMEDRLVEASAIAGLTGVSVPCGFVEGLSIGLQITGKQFDEKLVMEAAAVYQENTDYQKFPLLR